MAKIRLRKSGPLWKLTPLNLYTVLGQLMLQASVGVRWVTVHVSRNFPLLFKYFRLHIAYTVYTVQRIHRIYHTPYIPYILESNPHPFYSFRGLKYQMRIRIACGLDSRSWAGFWKNDRAAVRVVRTIQYNNLLFFRIFSNLIRTLFYRLRGLKKLDAD